MRFACVLLVACATANVAVPGPVEWSAPVEIATGGGTKGPWQQNDSQFDYVDDPTVALAPDGAAAVAWVDHRDKDVHFQIYERDGRARLAEPANVSRTPEVFSWLPRIVLAGRAVFVLWQEIVFSGGTHGGEIFFARSLDGGATWDPPVNLSRSQPGDGKGRLDAKTWHNGSLDLVAAPSGTLHAAWTEYDGPLWTSRSSDRGATWSAPLQIAGTRDRPARAPALAVATSVVSSAGDGAGASPRPARDRPAAGGSERVYVAWTVGEDPTADIQLARSDDGGRTWSAPAIVERTPGYSDAPDLAVGPGGTLQLVYAEAAGDWRAPSAIHHARSIDGGKTFGRSALLARGAAFPALVVDDDSVYVLWEVAEAGKPPRGLAMTFSHDDGATFAAPFPVTGSVGAGPNGSQQGRLMRKLAVHGDTIAVVNSMLDPGTSSRVWLVRGRRR